MGAGQPGSAGNGSGSASVRAVPIDLDRAIVFPNRMREERRRLGYAKLLRLASQIPDIPYIRLSKIERGEVVARADELRRVASVLGIAPRALLIDVEAQDFEITQWSEPFRDTAPRDLDGERFAVLLGAALRRRRANDPALTIAALDDEYGLPPVNLSRVENAVKTFDRWNRATQEALFAIFGVADEAELRDAIEEQYREGQLDEMMPMVSDPAARIDRTRARIRELADTLARDHTGDTTPAPPAVDVEPPAPSRQIEVRGGPLPGGLIADTATGITIAAPAGGGARAFGLKTTRATLGAGLPAQTIVIVDPDRFPTPGSLVALREDAGWRILSVGASRDGQMVGYSIHPELEVALDECDPDRLAGVVSATFP